MSSLRAPGEWHPGLRLAFRFVFAFFAAQVLPLLQRVVRWAGLHMLGIPDIVQRRTGSGDTMYSYVTQLCLLLLATAATLAWTALDHRRTDYRRLHDGLRVFLRCGLAAHMFLYGSVKIIKSQFPFPSLDTLIQTYGEASPMGLLWTFMGFSTSYNWFTGAGEILGGLLLFSRRTTTLGALVCAVVISHVVMLNFSYDVPVKLSSLRLLAMALVLLAPDLGRLARVFILNRPVPPATLTPLFRRRWLHVSGYALRTVFFAGALVFSVNLSAGQSSRLSANPPLYGLYDVDEFHLNGQARPPLLTDRLRWRRVVVERYGLSVYSMDGTRQMYTATTDEAQRRLTLLRRGDDEGAVLDYTETTPGSLVVEGDFGTNHIRAQLRRVDHTRLLLLSRGFHWVNEYPFNR